MPPGRFSVLGTVPPLASWGVVGCVCYVRKITSGRSPVASRPASGGPGGIPVRRSVPPAMRQKTWIALILLQWGCFLTVVVYVLVFLR